MPPWGQGRLPQRHHDILDEDAAPGMQIGAVAGHHGEEHDRGETALDPRRQDMAERHRHQHLRADLRLGNPVHVGDNPSGLGAVFRRAQDGERAEAEKRDHHDAREGAPIAEDIPHLRLVGIFGRAVESLVSLPGEIAVDKEDRADEGEPEVEVRGRARRIEGIDEPIPLRACRGAEDRMPRSVQKADGMAARERAEDLVPVEHDEKRDRDDEVEDAGKKPLGRVVDEDRELAAHQGRDERHRDENRHDEAKGGKQVAEDRRFLRKPDVVHEKPRGHGRKDREIDQPRKEAEAPGHDPELPAVANLEELRQGHRARLAVAVDDEAGHGDEEHDRPVLPEDDLPPRDGEPRPAHDLEEHHGGDGAEAGGADRSAEEVAARGAPGGEEVGDRAHVTLRAPGDGEDDSQRHRHDRPVEPTHASAGFISGKR